MDNNNYNIISLAYLGDSVYEVYIREYLIRSSDYKVSDISKKVIPYVCAKGQADLLDYLLEKNIFNDYELDIIKRGRNYKRSVHPKTTDIITYKKSTGFEALFGQLYIDGNIKRIEEIIREVKNANIW